ncbi:hypothetical protein [Nocardia sp. NPDC051833]|uniref:hypothetical protein n=1 Tax=Nocardia sp. NPDC051833 TaxID=3155674 RepID=UPI00342E55B1
MPATPTQDRAPRVSRQRSASRALTDVVARFEVDMRQRGSEVLTSAMTTVRWILDTDTGLGAAAAAVSTPILAAAARLRWRE